MKRCIILVLLFSVGFSLSVQAQKAGTKSKAKRTVAKKAATQKQSAIKASNTVTLTSVSANEAQAGASRRFSIADPTINVLNQRAAGYDVPISSSGIVGMPKGTYGFANGKILLRTTTATTSGTSYGSGAVGTGTTINGVGAAESAAGVNGKNPYAGPWLWGSRLPVQFRPQTDSLRRQ